MADEQKAPTEEQVKAANAAEEAKWQGDFDEDSLKVPYKREAPKEEEKKEEKPADESKEAKKEPKVEYEEPAPVITTQDPGDYQPQDYSFEIEVDGKTHKVESVDQAEKLADEFAEKLSAKQIMQLMTKASKMELNSDRDKATWQKDKDAYDKQVDEQNARMENVENIANGMAYLEGKKLLLAVPPELRDANWNDPEVAKNEAVAEQLELLNYYTTENKAREKAKLPPFGSIIDAFNAWKLENGDKHREQEEERRAAGEQRKAASARVAGVSSAPQTGYVPKGIAVGNPNVLRRGASVWDD